MAAPVVAQTVVADACTWLHTFRLDKGYETRWTRAEKIQAITLNRNIKKFCR